MSDKTIEPKPSVLGMIGSPTEQFERIKKRPAIWIAMILVMVVSAISTWLIAMGVETPEIEGIPADEAAAFNAFGQAMALIGGLIGPLFSVLIASAIYMLIAKIAQSQVSFKQLFSMHTYIAVIGALGSLLNGIIIAVVGGAPGIMYTSLGSLIGTEGSAMLSGIEVFSIWQVILTAIGLQVVARFSKVLAWAIPLAFFVLGLLFSIISAGLAGMGM
ncbi:Yip1 family protein [Bacillus piscicola]|uniref:Yip1 family protein n=1 Tax=Bacillus piscicola TaxID=1632684 RepID=UPI001F08B9CB|nr:Yip1 family protein [Bacillus piscicola]